MVNKTILFIATSLVEGGAGKMVHHIAGVLATKYVDVYAIAVNEERPITVNNGVKYLRPLCEHHGGIKGFYNTIRAIRKTVREISPNIVISFVSDVAVSTRIATLGMKDIIVASADRGDPYTLGQPWEFLCRWAYRNSDYCFFQLEKTRDFFDRKVRDKSFVIPNAAFFNGKVGSHQRKNKTIVGAGRFVWEKGFEDLIEVFNNIHKKHPDYSLILYGDGPFQLKYEEKVHSLDLDNCVSFPGYTNNIADALLNEGVFVLPSRYEGIPNVLIEALLIGIPTVSYDCNPGGPRFLTNGGERGELVSANDKEGLERSIIKIIEDEDLYSKYEKEGPGIITQLSPEKVENKWLDAFQKILS